MGERQQSKQLAERKYGRMDNKRVNRRWATTWKSDSGIIGRKERGRYVAVIWIVDQNQDCPPGGDALGRSGSIGGALSGGTLMDGRLWTLEGCRFTPFEGCRWTSLGGCRRSVYCGGNSTMSSSAGIASSTSVWRMKREGL